MLASAWASIPTTMPREEWQRAARRSAKRRPTREHEEVVALGGLHILGTERHESRRIDNQLRGRAGRQGDPGARGSSCRCRTTDAHLRRRAHAEPDAAARHGRGCADRVEADHQAHRSGAEGRRSAELRSPQTPARVRRRDEQAAPGRLRHAPPAARRQRSDASAFSRSSAASSASFIDMRVPGGRAPGHLGSGRPRRPTS